MKILIFSHEFPPQIGGAGVVAEEYATCLTSAGHDVTVLTQLREDATYSTPYKIIQVKTLSRLWFFFYRNAVDFHEYDLIILNDIPAAYTAGLFFRKSLLSKSIMILHGSEPETIFLKPSIFRRVALFKKVYIRVLNYICHIVAVSRFMSDKFLNYTNLEFLTDKITVLHNFINHNVFYPSPDPLFRESLGLPNDAFLLVTAGRVVFGKGYREKLMLFKRLNTLSNRNLYWIIVGDGDDLQEIKTMVNSIGLSSKVLFLGSVPRNDLPRIYSSADLFWMLSNFQESLGLVYIEAQACGCPALARNSAGAKEAIVNGKTGYLIDSDEQVLTLFNSSNFLKFDKAHLTSFAQEFHCESLVNFISNFNFK
jgi:glycosyltransferase involved in cell wall biosynthesis